MPVSVSRRRPTSGRRRGLQRRTWLLIIGLTALLCGLAATAWAATPSPPHLAAASPASPPVTAPPLPLPTADPCTPGSPIPACALPTPTPTAPTPGTSTSPPCTGEDCIPQPNPAPPPATGAPDGGGGGSSGGSDCGVFDIGGCITGAINGLFADLVNAALTPVLDLLGNTVLSTPTLDQLPGVAQLWGSDWQIVLGVYGLLIIIGGILVMSHESVQTQYSIKEIGPRIVLGFLVSALSLFFADKVIRLANALTLTFLGSGVAPTALDDNLRQLITSAVSGGLFTILVGLLLVVLSMGLLIVYVVRVIITLILIVAGPLFLMCHALPQTDPIARWWWRAFGLVEAIQLAQSLVLVIAIRFLLTSGVWLFGSPLSSLGLMFAAIGLFFVLFKIPFWFLAAARGGGRRSLVGGIIRTLILTRVLGAVGAFVGGNRIGGRTAAAGSGSRSRSGATSRGGAAWGPLPHRAPSAPTTAQRLQAQYNAQRQQAARRSRVPSQAPRFLQPTPQIPIHDYATGAATHAPGMPGFSAPPTADTPRPNTGSPPAPPPFQRPGGTQGRSATPSMRTATAPPALRFQPPVRPGAAPTTTPSTSGTPVRPAGPPPETGFRTATRAPTFGPTPPRTHTPSPVQFRAPTPPPPSRRPSSGGVTP